MRRAIVICILLVIALVAVVGIVNAAPGNGNGNGNGNGGNGADKIEICHATGNGGFVIVDVDKDAWDEHNSAHSDHEFDVPAVDGLCPDDNPEDPTEEPTDDPDEPRVTPGAPSTASQAATCLDVFHPFLAVSDYSPAAKAYLVQGTTWAGDETDMSTATYTQLLIVPADYNPADRDTVRAGNDAGILCVGVLPQGPQIIAYVMPDGTVAGLVEVQEIDDSIVILRATILRWDILTYDPLWDGVPGVSSTRWDFR